jgi:hypothetical protein
MLAGGISRGGHQAQPVGWGKTRPDTEPITTRAAAGAAARVATKH